MQKLIHLRQYLLNKQHLGLAADTLHSFVDETSKVVSNNFAPTAGELGANIGVNTPDVNDNFIIDYVATLIVTDYDSDFNLLAFEVIQWLNQYEPRRTDEAFTFKADILNAKAADVEISIKLKEVIKVNKVPTGIELKSCVNERQSL